MNKKTVAEKVPVARLSKYLTFTLGPETYAFPVLNVREIIHLCPMTPVPRMPPYVKGIINLRGSVVPVLDLRAKFEISASGYGERACIIVVQVPLPLGGRALLGTIVDTVEEVISLNEAGIEPPPDFGGAPDMQYILGVSTAAGGVKTLLNVEKIFLEDAEQAMAGADAPDDIRLGTHGKSPKLLEKENPS